MTQPVLHTSLFLSLADGEVQMDVAVQRNGNDDGEPASEPGESQRRFERALGDEDAKRRKAMRAEHIKMRQQVEEEAASRCLEERLPKQSQDLVCRGMTPEGKSTFAWGMLDVHATPRAMRSDQKPDWRARELTPQRALTKMNEDKKNERHEYYARVVRTEHMHDHHDPDPPGPLNPSQPCAQLRKGTANMWYCKNGPCCKTGVFRAQGQMSIGLGAAAPDRGAAARLWGSGTRKRRN